MDVKPSFNEEIMKELDHLKGRVKTYKSMQEIINKKFNTSFKIYEVRRKVKKLFAENFGKASEDAYNFLKLSEEQTKEEGYFEFECDDENHFQRSIFLSKTMLLYADLFLDVVIVDSTYKRNRFNIPIVNVIGVNNFGHNIMLAFGLLSNETSESYIWFFEHLKHAWRNKNPPNFIVDDSEAIQQGKNLYWILFFNF